MVYTVCSFSITLMAEYQSPVTLSKTKTLKVMRKQRKVTLDG